MKSRLLLLLLAACITTRAFAATELSPPERAALLQQLRELHAKQPSLESDFTEQKTTHLLNKPITTEGTVWFHAPDKFKREVRGKNPSITVSNGKTLWIYYPNFKEAETYALGQRQFFDDSISALNAGLNFQRIDEFYNFRAFREGDGSLRLELTPRRPNLRRIVEQLILFLDSDFHPQRTELTLPKGDHLTTVYKNPRRAPLPASTFEFTPPPDAHVSRPLGK
jgi:outer membrane lipoprotein carrier protein